MSTIASPTELNRFPFGQVAKWLSEGMVIPFLGAGASRIGAEEPLLPDGRGLAEELIEAMGNAFPINSTRELAKVAQYFQDNVFGRPALYDHLHQRFEKEQRNNPPGLVATILARMPRERPLFIVTTNYDSYVERAFRRAERPLCIITQNMRDSDKGVSVINLILPDGSQTQEDSRDFDWKDEERFDPDCAYLYKMHGSAHRPSPPQPDDVIITEDDYVDFIVNLGGTLSPYFPPPSLTLAFKKRPFLFLGYSLYDWNFRAFLRILTLKNAITQQNRSIAAPRNERRHWAVRLNPDEAERELWERRNVNVYAGDLREFCEHLTASWETEGR